MKFEIVQPYYSMNYNDADECFSGLISLMEKCSDEADVIVLPEYCDTPAAYVNKTEFDTFIDKYNKVVINMAAKTAIRCNALVFINALCETEFGYRNTTYAIDENGIIIDKYFKAHPAPSEVRKVDEGGHKFDVSYSYLYDEPYVFEHKGVRYGFMTCYDFYFYESFAPLARKNVDIIIGASHQRTDTHQALEIIGKFLSYNTNAYLVRSSVSLGNDSKIGGSSMVVAPDGTMLANMKSNIGICECEINPHEKYFKPAGFGGKTKSHFEYIEEGRRPWNYRPAGSAICLPNDIMPYPRVCAHRGYSLLLPENSMPAFGAAISLGADEIEFDLWPTKDGEVVSCHDSTLDRVSTGNGKIFEHTYDELSTFDFGVKFDEKLKGLKIVKFEEILQKFSCHTVMNIHIKPLSIVEKYPEEIMRKIVSLIKKYDCEKYVYFMLEPDIHIKQFKEYAPHIPVCVGHLSDRPYEIVDRAIELGAEKVQLFKPYFNQEMIDKAHENGIRCNVFWSDDEEETQKYLDMGIDTILTNDFGRILPIIKNN